MSLQLAAQHLSSQGRGSDSTLVHMSPREVKSLNDIAMAHGGHLTINPETGLPEAGFLESILPAVAGFALNAAMPGSGMMVPALVGGGMALMTGSLEKGLMAGLGAYGGANLGQALAAQGVEQAAQASMTDAMREQAMAGTLAQGSTTLPNQVSMSTAAQEAALKDYNKLGFMEKMGKNFETLTSPGGAGGLFDKISSSPMSLLKTVGSAAAPAIGEAMTPKKLEEEKANADMGQRYGFSMNPAGGQSSTGAQSRSLEGGQQQVQPGQDPFANRQTPTTTPFPTPDIYGREQRYFAPSYTKLTPEQAKSMYGYAEGGVANEDKPTETPALQAFKQMQAQRAIQPQTPQYASTPATGGSPAADTPAPSTVEGLYTTYLDRASDKGGLEHWNKLFGPTVDAKEAALFRSSAAPELAANKRLAQKTGGPLAHEFNEYLRQTVGAPNQLQAPTTPPPTTTGLADSGYAFDPIKQQYTQIKGTAPAETAADAFNVENRPIVGYTATGEKIYGEKKTGPYGTAHWTSGMGSFAAEGGLMAAYAGGGMAESNRRAASSSSVGTNTHYPQAHTLTNRFSMPAQIPISEDVVSGGARIDLSTGEERLATGGISDAGYNLGGYSDGGRLLRGPGDGVSDSIPAVIGKRQPARLADGEFVVPARIVSELGNGSTEAGARKLYAMMDRIQKARGKTVGKGKVAKNSRSEKYLPA